jgi:hypothetical protein
MGKGGEFFASFRKKEEEKTPCIMHVFSKRVIKGPPLSPSCGLQKRSIAEKLVGEAIIRWSLFS